MNATDVIPVKEISKGTIKAVIDGEDVRFVVEYKSKDLTSVGVRVGIIGNRKASQRLHDKVADYLLEGNSQSQEDTDNQALSTPSESDL